MAWLRWEVICKPKREGGLGIKNLKWFNLSLLCKWVWRFINEENRLWARIIRSRHGCISCNHDGIRAEGIGSSPGWWRKILSLADGDDGKWFCSKLALDLGDGSLTSFWNGLWAGDLSMKDRFPRLFNLNLDKNGKVSDMGEWVCESWNWKFRWRRNFLAREEASVNDMMTLLQSFSLKKDVLDRWKWGCGSSGVFSVMNAYNEIMKANCSSTPSTFEADCNFVWKSIAPHKAQVTAWRILWDCLPTYDNLISRINCLRSLALAAAAPWYLRHRNISSLDARMLPCCGIRLWHGSGLNGWRHTG